VKERKIFFCAVWYDLRSMTIMEKININCIGLALFTSPLMLWLTMYSKCSAKLYVPAFVILESLNVLLLSRAISGARNNEEGAVLGFALSLQAIILTFVVFVLPLLF